MIRKIVVAVDNNNQAVRAVQTAAALATAVGARIYLLYVVPDDVFNAKDDTSNMTVRHMENALARLAAPYARLVKQRSMTHGAAVKGIVDHAQSVGADLVVVATQHLNSTVSLEVVQTAPCPVMVITPAADAAQAA